MVSVTGYVNEQDLGVWEANWQPDARRRLETT